MGSRRSEFLCRRCNQSGLIQQDAAHNHDALVSLLPLFLFNGFADGRHGFRRVSSVVPWRVKLVLEPRAIWQAIGSEQLPLTLNEQPIDLGERIPA